MDADTRHQLRQNELAEALAKLRDYTDKRTLAWLAVIIAIALGYAGYRYWRWRQGIQLAQGYEALSSVDALDASLGEAPLAQLRQLIAEASQPGLVALARLELAQGLEVRGERAEDAAKLAEAKSEYQRIVAMADAPAHVKAAALYRLGMVYETERDFVKARETFTTLSSDSRFEGSPQQQRATQRLGLLAELAVPVRFKPGAKPLLPAQTAQPGAWSESAEASPVTRKPPAAPTTQPAREEEKSSAETTDVAPAAPPPTESNKSPQP